MPAVFATDARLPAGWAKDVRIAFEDTGQIVSVIAGAPAEDGDKRVGPVIPAMANLHSHAFQRGMAGLGEARTRPGDDFWSWREVMYRFLDRIGPDEVEAIATQLYVEMVEAGYGRVCEFHYLHNDPCGARYADPLEMASAHVRAAATAGIGLTLVPVLYTHAAFGGAEPTHGQRRFIQTTDQYLEMWTALTAEAGKDGFDLAASIHSLRAVTPQQITDVVGGVPAGLPIHIHIAEQTKEVNDCLAWSGKRPVQWMLDHVGLSDRWRLVHATHMTPDEAHAAAQTGAVAVLCPTTEGNLGDGFFQADAWFAANGVIALGTDSHVTIDPREELRWLEYGRRLNHRKRGLSEPVPLPNPGAALWLDAAKADARGGGVQTGRIEPGWRADFLVLDAGHPNLAGRSGDAILDSLVFVSNPGPSPIAETWIGGRRITEAGRHPRAAETARAYAKVVSRLAE
jgi:formimidoylglutamate deiminase